MYADASSASFVSNPNELLLVDLSKPEASGTNPRSLVLRSFGGRPQRFTFTEPLDLPGPGGLRRLLVVETEQDVAIVDLSHPELPEITVQLTSGQDTRRVQPAGVTISDGDKGPGDTRLAIRLQGDTSIVVATLVAATARDFRPEINLTDVGGIPSATAFVRTDNGSLALAALVPARSAARLIDPATGVTVDVPLPAPYQSLSLVTPSTTSAAATPGADVALLWSGERAAGGVAFWELGHTAGQPYRAVETIGVAVPVSDVLDVPGEHPELKLLRTVQNQFFLLNLATRESSPFQTRDANVQLHISDKGDRAWAFSSGSRDLSTIDLSTQHPQSMAVDRSIQEIFDIDAVESTPAAAPGETLTQGSKRSLLVMSGEGNRGLTIYDAEAPGGLSASGEDLLNRRRNVSALLLEDLNASAP